MKTRQEIEDHQEHINSRFGGQADGKLDALLEVFLDIRDLLVISTRYEAKAEAFQYQGTEPDSDETNAA